MSEGYEPTSQTLISGMIDTINVDPIKGIVAVEGRDLSSTLIDLYRQQDFVNQTASEVASAVALYHGLVPAVTPTLSNVGRYFGDGNTRLSLGQFSRFRTDWDLVTISPRENAFDVFVQDTTLFFQPADAAAYMPVRLALRDVKTMRFEQTLTMASNATARVQSWNSQNMTSYDSSQPGGDSNEPTDPTATGDQPFLFAASNFTSQQVTDAAAQYTAELNRLGIALHIEMPWDLALSPRTIILIDETNSAFDTTYKLITSNATIAAHQAPVRQFAHRQTSIYPSKSPLSDFDSYPLKIGLKAALCRRKTRICRFA